MELARLKWVSRGWLQRVKGLKTLLLNNVLLYSMRPVVLTVTIIFIWLSPAGGTFLGVPPLPCFPLERWSRPIYHMFTDAWWARAYIYIHTQSMRSPALRCGPALALHTKTSFPISLRMTKTIGKCLCFSSVWLCVESYQSLIFYTAEG